MNAARQKVKKLKYGWMAYKSTGQTTKNMEGGQGCPRWNIIFHHEYTRETARELTRVNSITRKKGGGTAVIVTLRTMD